MFAVEERDAEGKVAIRARRETQIGLHSEIEQRRGGHRDCGGGRWWVI